MIQIFAANAGNRVVHLTPADENERMKQRFITHVIYAEMSLLSSIICSIGVKWLGIILLGGGGRFSGSSLDIHFLYRF